MPGQDNIHSYEPLWGSWYVEEEIGEGSFGIVYKVRKEELGHAYISAVKLISIPDSAQFRDAESRLGDDSSTLRKYFLPVVQNIVKEVNILNSLSGNSNILGYHDHQVVERQDRVGWDVLIRMEYIKPLKKYLREHAMSQNEVIRLGIDLCRALELCSKRGLIHRDIKDDNIFVNDDGIFKLGDFGIAKELTKVTTHATRIGTISYMAPEVYLGKKYDELVDIYSLGIVMYRLLNNLRLPFLPPYPEEITALDDERAQDLRLSGEPLPKPANADDALAAIVLKACSFKPEDRYQSATLFKAALEALLSASSPGDESEAGSIVQAPVEKPGQIQGTVSLFDRDDIDQLGKEAITDTSDKAGDSLAGSFTGKPVNNPSNNAESGKPFHAQEPGDEQFNIDDDPEDFRDDRRERYNKPQPMLIFIIALLLMIPGLILIRSLFISNNQNVSYLDEDTPALTDFQDTITPAPIDTPDTDTPVPNDSGEQAENIIEVQTIAEFLNAVRPNTSIKLLPGDYNLAHYPLIVTSGEFQPNEYVSYNDTEFPYGIRITGVTNLMVYADERQLIYTSIPDDNVLSIVGSTDCEFRNVSIGHEEAGWCGGYVLNVQESQDIRFIEDDIFGCGTVGLYALNSSNIRIENSDIHDCTYKAMEISASSDITLYNCRLFNTGNTSCFSLVEVGGDSVNISLDSCSIYDNGNPEYEEIAKNNYSLEEAPCMFLADVSSSGQLTLTNCTGSNNFYPKVDENNVNYSNTDWNNLYRAY